MMIAEIMRILKCFGAKRPPVGVKKARCIKDRAPLPWRRGQLFAVIGIPMDQRTPFSLLARVRRRAQCMLGNMLLQERLET